MVRGVVITSRGARSAAEQAVIDRASRIAVPGSTPRYIVTAIEDAALERIDRGVARQIVELDRRFSRSYSAIVSDSRRTHSADDGDSRPSTYGSSIPDVTGMMASIVAFAIVIAGSGSGSRPTIPFDLSAQLAVGRSYDCVDV